MTISSFQSLEEAISDEHFPEVDLALRRGRHVGRDDGSAYDYLVDTSSTTSSPSTDGSDVT